MHYRNGFSRNASESGYYARHISKTTKLLFPSSATPIKIPCDWNVYLRIDRPNLSRQSPLARPTTINPCIVYFQVLTQYNNYKNDLLLRSPIDLALSAYG